MPSTERALVRGLAAVGIAVALLAGAACSDDGPDQADPGSTEPATETSASSASSASDRPSGLTPEDLPEAPELADAVGVRADVTVDECSAEAPLGASGTVTNSAAAAADVVIVVNWTTEPGSDVVARGVAVVEDLAAGESGEWSVESPEAPPGASQCVVNARRGSLVG